MSQQYGTLLRQALSMEGKQSDDENEDDPEYANQEGYVEQGEVLINLPVGVTPFDPGMEGLGASLESKGWKVKFREAWQYSAEDSSDGIHSGQPAMDGDNAKNTVVNGVFIPELKSNADVYKVVQVVRPEDTIKAGNSNALYLMNDDGEIKDLLENEGHLVASEADALHLLLASQSDGSRSDGA